jgi:hypothetical protein
MDPQACLVDLLRELASDTPDREEVLERLSSLTDWIMSGGFLPKIAATSWGSSNPGSITVVVVKQTPPAGWDHAND